MKSGDLQEGEVSLQRLKTPVTRRTLAMTSGVIAAPSSRSRRSLLPRLHAALAAPEGAGWRQANLGPSNKSKCQPEFTRKSLRPFALLPVLSLSLTDSRLRGWQHHRVERTQSSRTPSHPSYSFSTKPACLLLAPF